MEFFHQNACRFKNKSYLCIRNRERKQPTNNGVVVQLVRIPACHAGGRGFESRPYRRSLGEIQGFLIRLFRKKGIRFDSLAQQVEHNTFNVGVLGSSPKRITERRDLKESLSFSNILITFDYQKVTNHYQVFTLSVAPIKKRGKGDTAGHKKPL